jgi:hypothetical protein
MSAIGKRRLFALGVIALAIATAAGAASVSPKNEKQLTKEADAFIANKPEELKPFFHTLYMEGEWNAVLNLDLLALASLELSRRDIARAALDESTARIQRIYANDPNAEKAKSLWAAESVKDFKGEPYERAMAFYYRGLLYLADADPDNASAAFLQADYQNALGLKEHYDRSFALPTYLAAWVQECTGNHERALDLRRQAQGGMVDPFYQQLPPDAFPKHLTLIERGIGPEKVTLGEAHAILGFLPQPDLQGQMRIDYAKPPDGRTVEGVAANVDWLALTRGGRPIQGILDNKAAFKQTTGNIAAAADTLGEVSFYSSLSTLGQNKFDVARNLGMMGAGASVVGALASILSHNANSEADTRYWASLPKFVMVNGDLDDATVVVKSFQATIASKPRPVMISARIANRCSLDFGREVSALDAIQGGVGNPDPWPAAPVETHRAVANDAFRTMLRSTF